jgi:hypothetical protein
MAAAISREDVTMAEQLIQSVQPSFRMFIIGAAVPAVAWGIIALEINRTHKTIKLFESGLIYFLVLVSLVLFVIAAWRLPVAIISSARAEAHLQNYRDQGSPAGIDARSRIASGIHFPKSLLSWYSLSPS